MAAILILLVLVLVPLAVGLYIGIHVGEKRAKERARKQTYACKMQTLHKEVQRLRCFALRGQQAILFSDDVPFREELAQLVFLARQMTEALPSPYEGTTTSEKQMTRFFSFLEAEIDTLRDQIEQIWFDAAQKVDDDE